MYTQNTRPFPNIPPATLNLIIINIIFWGASIILPTKFNIDIYGILGLHYWEGDKFNPIQLISYMFMHQTSAGGAISFSHIFFNMFSVFMFGRVLEQVWGAKKFLFYYFVTGIGAGLMQEVVWTFEFGAISRALSEGIASGSSSAIVEYIPFLSRYFTNVEAATITTEGMQYLQKMLLNMPVTVGASGAVFGILLAFGWMFPNEKLMLIFFPVPIKARYFVLFYGLVELFFGVANFNFDKVAHFAHLGGMVFGAILLFYWKQKGKLFFRQI